ncbi:MAG: aldehyde dehydrogenase [Sphingobacteriales bacterium]|jgi:aldehyde dehydrogenase (NAD+)|nr:aldehyde dehydrogenase [Sphingobacteriales bacterium]MBP9142656.1 aldehyde dehydrogenase [Chitinophagales bacterium]MDA0199636.1 aldehyde dehydrogenase [Bacteroidota bacterium]MBK6888726.1 aldehyde dehydrogenase [Sphingobacteriales bacterium]MBK7528767.1 aldehyde dehydrogenase [Sphingobacteriales bacterium]
MIQTSTAVITNTDFESNDTVTETTIAEIKRKQLDFFNTGVTKTLDFRIAQLKKLRAAVLKYEQELLNAQKTDYNKPNFESYALEIGLVIIEIDRFIKKLAQWAKPTPVKTPLFFFKSNSFIYREPLGQVLIIGPWNYPVLLMLRPIIGAISGGNTIVVKPSELATKTSAVVANLLRETFPEYFVAVFEGGPNVASSLLQHKWDFIFFTGSSKVGKIVYQAAAKHLTPVVLELGGKSPVIVHRDANLPVAAKRIVWGKFINGGQTCIAPDYLLVHEAVKNEFVQYLIAAIQKQYGEDAQKSPDYCRIINERNFLRLAKMLPTEGIIYGGHTDYANLYISPTLVEGLTPNAPLMQEEIFGPILPIFTYKNLDEAVAFVNQFPKPLSAYFFTENTQISNQLLNDIPAGGGCINDTVIHFGNDALPFGGVGESGMGNYGGKQTYQMFTNQKGYINHATNFDPWMRYPPYKLPLKLVKKMLKWTL